MVLLTGGSGLLPGEGVRARGTLLADGGGCDGSGEGEQWGRCCLLQENPGGPVPAAGPGRGEEVAAEAGGSGCRPTGAPARGLPTPPHWAPKRLAGWHLPISQIKLSLSCFCFWVAGSSESFCKSRLAAPSRRGFPGGSDSKESACNAGDQAPGRHSFPVPVPPSRGELLN